MSNHDHQTDDQTYDIEAAENGLRLIEAGQAMVAHGERIRSEALRSLAARRADQMTIRRGEGSFRLVGQPRVVFDGDEN